jgi:hypothetical protein
MKIFISIFKYKKIQMELEDDIESITNITTDLIPKAEDYDVYVEVSILTYGTHLIEDIVDRAKEFRWKNQSRSHFFYIVDRVKFDCRIIRLYSNALNSREPPKISIHSNIYIFHVSLENRSIDVENFISMHGIAKFASSIPYRRDTSAYKVVRPTVDMFLLLLKEEAITRQLLPLNNSASSSSNL